MRRREFIVGLGGTAAAWPLAARAQPAMPVIGFLSSRSPGESAGVVSAFRDGLRERELVEGRNVAIAFRWAEGRYDRLPALATELVRLPVAAIVAAGGTPAALAARGATSTIPIVVSSANDLVRIGLVTSLNKPGGNVTGMSAFNADLAAKRIELMRQLIPNADSFAYLVNPSNQSVDLESSGVSQAAASLGLQVHMLNAKTEDDLTTAFAAVTKLKAGGLIVSGDPFFDSRRERLVALSAQNAVASNFAWREYVQAGGLISYGTDLSDSYRQAGVYIGRILNGEKPAELPVMQPSKFHLAVNLKTAKALGLDVPLQLQQIADEVIE
jgi:ABC-type uncharacterized transport system substrate-binding protein